MNKRIPAAIVIAALGVGATVLASSSATRDDPKAETQTIHANQLTDFSDPRRLAGYVDLVVVASLNPAPTVPDTPADPTPTTYWTAHVERVLKGTPPSDVLLVGQRGGTDPETGAHVVVEGAKPLAAGKTHVLALLDDRPNGGRWLVAPEGAFAPTQTTPLSELEERLTEAVRNQIPYTEPEATYP